MPVNAPPLHSTLPDAQTITNAAKLSVYDKSGQAVDFGTLFHEQKTIVVFIRHFFCGMCQQYVMQLATVRTEALEEAGTRIAIVGCGDWTLIRNYCETTGFDGAMFADPARGLYDTFGLVESLDRTPAGHAKRSYAAGSSFLGNALKSIWDGPLKNPLSIGKQGKLSQLGGDFVFGPGEHCSYASRMQHTEDHVEVTELMHSAGVSYP